MNRREDLRKLLGEAHKRFPPQRLKDRSIAWGTGWDGFAVIAHTSADIDPELRDRVKAAIDAFNRNEREWPLAEEFG